MKYIKVTVDAPMLPSVQGIKHIGTSYQIGSDINLNIQDNILVESLNDTVNLRVWYAQVDVPDDTTLFVRTKYHFSLNGEAKESNWSRTLPVNSNQSGMKMSNTIIKTPIVNTEAINNKLNITTSDMSVLMGNTEQKSTTYRIADSDNTIVWYRSKDEDNLVTIEVDNVTQPGKLYTIQAKHNNATNNSSNYGKVIYLNANKYDRLFKFEAPEDLVYDRKFYYRIKIYTPKFKSYDLEFRDSDNNVLISKTDVQTTADYIFPRPSELPEDSIGVIEVGKIYNIFVKINFIDDTSTDFYNVFNSKLLENRVIPYKPLATYKDKFHYLGQLNIYGTTSMCVRQTYDNKFIMPDYKTKTLCLYIVVDNTLQFVKELYTYTDVTNINYFNIVQLSNHDILVDIYCVKDTKNISRFTFFAYDPIKLELTKLRDIDRIDETTSTAMANSLLPLGNGKIYYIPASLSNNGNLSLCCLNNDSTAVEEKYLLRTNVTNYASLFSDNLGNIYVYGGTNDKVNIIDKDIYKFNADDGSFTKITTLPDNFPNTLYKTQPFTRLDGKIAFFNAVDDGDSLDFQDVIVFDIEDNKFSTTSIDIPVSVPFTITLSFNNGNAERISTLTADPQYSRLYIADTMPDDSIQDITDNVEEDLDLIVHDGEVITITDIYKYRSITILDSGLLNWVRPQGLTVLTSKILLVYKTMTITSEKIRESKYEGVLALDGRTLTIT